MPGRPRLQLAGAALVLVGLVLAGVAIADLVANDDEPVATTSISRALTGATESRAPFPGLTETQIRVGDRALRVVLADDAAERSEGLRERDALAPYDGMLFVYDEVVDEQYTMSTVPVALDIAFYDGSGRVVSRQRMAPCAKSESECPLYAASGPYVFALETLAGDLPTGRLH